MVMVHGPPRSCFGEFCCCARVTAMIGHRWWLVLVSAAAELQCRNQSIEKLAARPAAEGIRRFQTEALSGHACELLSECPNNLVKDGVKDFAYLYATPRGFGFLTLSELSQGLDRTFCRSCYLGVASAGGAGLDDEKDVILSVLKAAVSRLGTQHPMPDGAWYFFDDKEDNIRPFSGTSYNALQVSCESRRLVLQVADLEGLVACC
eukprot:Skav232197  [mRNA]  locus=scaffold3716:44248:51842:+ [translate_table: standard]